MTPAQHSRAELRPLARPRAEHFPVRPRVEFDNRASNRFTVIEVNARDRPALLNRLARALFEARLIVHSAHITAYGEAAADTFYVTDLTSAKIKAADRLAEIEAARVAKVFTDSRGVQAPATAPAVGRVDPATGLGLTRRIACTVIAPNAMTSDGTDNAVCVLGVEKGLAAVRRTPGLKARVVTLDADGAIHTFGDSF